MNNKLTSDRNKFFSYLLKCPKKLNDPTCPLCKYRNLTTREKFKFAEIIPLNQMMEYLMKHNECKRELNENEPNTE